jgi:hypothetical protein
MRGGLLHRMMAMSTSAMTGGEFLHTMDDLATTGVLGCQGGGRLAACKEGSRFRSDCCIWSWLVGRSGTSQIPLEGWRVHFDLVSDKRRSLNQKGQPWVGLLYTWRTLGSWSTPELLGFFGGGVIKGNSVRDLPTRSRREI